MSPDTRNIFQSKEDVNPPPPWRPVPIHFEKALAVGFGPGTDLLVVLDHDGLTVLDCANGAVLAVSERESLILEARPLIVDGIGPLSGQRVRLAAEWGGGLSLWTPDDWRLRCVAPNWPEECAVLLRPDDARRNDWDEAMMVAKDLEYISALGFSDTGRSLVILSSLMLLWVRD